MNGIISPTDSRYRPDLRSFENNEIAEADVEKVKLEVEQRRKRKVMQGKGETWVANFFKKVNHPVLKDNDIIKTLEDRPIQYQLIEGSNNGYWERRSRGDWSGMPELFGPFLDNK